MTGRILRAAVSALCPALLATGDARSDATAVVRVDTRAIEGTRRGPTRRARVRPRPPVQSSYPLDAWRTLRDEPWRRYRHHVTRTKEPAGLTDGLWLSRNSRRKTPLRRFPAHVNEPAITLSGFNGFRLLTCVLYPSKRRSTRQALCPPKPNEFETAIRMSALRASLGM
jgi:hypothetical protein